MTGIEQRAAKEHHRSEQIAPDRSTSQQSMGLAFSITDQITTIWKHVKMRCVAFYYDSIRSDAMITIEN